MTSHECYRPPIDAQLRYMVQWFHEWSEMQRGDFLPILAQKLAPGSYVNGLVSGVDNLGCGDGRPPSLFQCRVKLFKEWFESWGQAERDQLLGHIKNMDPSFYSKVQEELKSISSGDAPVMPSNNSDPSAVDDGEEPALHDAPDVDDQEPAQVLTLENGAADAATLED